MDSPCSQKPHARIATLGRDGDTWFQVQSLGSSSRPRVQQQAPPFGFSFPQPGPPGPVPRRHRYYEGATTSCRPSRCSSLPSLGGTSVALVLFAPLRTSAPPRPGVGNPVSPTGMLPRKRQDLPSSWGTPIVRLHMIQSDSGRTAHTRPLRCSSVALGQSKAKAPANGLSKLNSMAFGLAVYASPGSLPHHDARLASGRWSDATGRAFHPQGSYERFQICFLTSHPPFPSFAWHNDRDLCFVAAIAQVTEEGVSWRPGWIVAVGPSCAGRNCTRCCRLRQAISPVNRGDYNAYHIKKQFDVVESVRDR